MLYVADHGQTLYDGKCGLAFHCHNTQHEFHVPAPVWHSGAYRASYPNKVARLHRRKRARLSTENVFHLLLGMANIRYAGEQLERGFFSKQFKPHKPYVDSYSWTDYDHAAFTGECREVIAKGRPLRRDQHLALVNRRINALHKYFPRSFPSVLKKNGSRDCSLKPFQCEAIRA